MQVSHPVLQLIDAFKYAINGASLLLDTEFSGNGIPLRHALLCFYAQIDDLLHKLPIISTLGRGAKDCDGSNELAGFAFAEGQTEGALASNLPCDSFFKVRIMFGVLWHFDRLHDKAMAAIFQPGDVLARLQK